MWKAEYKILECTTKVDKTIPFSNGSIIKHGTVCTIVNTKYDCATVLFMGDNPLGEKLYLEYNIKDLCFRQELTKVFRVD